MVGWTTVADFPTTDGAYDTSFNGSEAFVTKLNPSGTSLLYSTFLGGSCGNNSITAIALDDFGNAYLAGGTKCNDFPTTLDAYDTVLNNDDSTTYTDVFVAKLGSNGSELLYSTFFGGIYNEHIRDIVLDSSGDVYVIGNTSYLSINSGFPITPGTYSSEGNSNANIFISRGH